MANGRRPPAGPGCLSAVVGVLALAAVAVLVFFVGLIALGVLAAIVVVGLLVLAVDRILLALSPSRRERRAAQSRMFVWQFGQAPPGTAFDPTAFDPTLIDTTVIDTTVIDTTAPETPPGDGRGPGELTQE